MNKPINLTILFTGLLLFHIGVIPALHAQEQSFSIERATAMALEKNPSVESAHWDWLAACASAEEARLKMFPSLNISGSYQKLSDIPPASMTIGTMTYTFPESLTNIYSFSANLMYPVFAGFRIREAAAIAGMQSRGKYLAIESIKRALLFEVRRAYWEAVRATFNVAMLRKNLELTAVNRDLTAKYAAQGTATKSEQLTADSRYQQADLDLGDAVSMQRRAYLVLAALTGRSSTEMHYTDASLDAAMPFVLTTQPEANLIYDFGDNPDETVLINEALEKRPETRISILSSHLAEHSKKLAEAGLYPSVSITGNYTFADPNPRSAFQSDPALFTGTWVVGIQVSYDLGGLPVTLKEREARQLGINKAHSDVIKQQESVMMDVRTCLLGLSRARRDVEITSSMVDQAGENLRVVQEKADLGMAGNADLLNAQVSLLRAHFTVTNKKIDLHIAASDLSRAVARDEIQ
ncbi:MAG: TolC family protein [Spirochaetales bacterium]|nr:TolC family protein [Spirochaetales bacterium]